MVTSPWGEGSAPAPLSSADCPQRPVCGLQGAGISLGWVFFVFLSHLFLFFFLSSSPPLFILFLLSSPSFSTLNDICSLGYRLRSLETHYGNFLSSS